MAMCEQFRGAKSQYAIREDKHSAKPWKLVHIVGKTEHVHGQYVERSQAEAVLKTLEAKGKKTVKQASPEATGKVKRLIWSGKTGQGLGYEDALVAKAAREESRKDLEWHIEPAQIAGRFKVVGYGTVRG